MVVPLVFNNLLAVAPLSHEAIPEELVTNVEVLSVAAVVVKSASRGCLLLRSLTKLVTCPSAMLGMSAATSEVPDVINPFAS